MKSLLKSALPLVFAFVAAPHCSGVAAPSSPPVENDKFRAGVAFINAAEFAKAFAEFRSALLISPHDVRLLQLTGYAALRSGSPHEAERYFNLAVEENPPNPWPLQLALINSYAAESRWEDFDSLRSTLRHAVQSGDPRVARATGYVIESFTCAGRPVTVSEYPTPRGPFYVRYRFSVGPAIRTAARTDFASVDAAGQTNDSYQINLVSSLDRRGFTLQSQRNWAPQTIAMYRGQEPSYAELRAQVIATACPVF